MEWDLRLTKVVGAGPELGDLESGGPGRNGQDLLITQRATPLSEVPRDKATGRIITPTDATAIWMPARAEDAITARALGESRVRQRLLEARHHFTPWPGLLGACSSPQVLTFAIQVKLFLCQHPHPQLASRKLGRARGWGGRLSHCSHLLLSLTWQVRTLLSAISAWCSVIVIMNKESE